MQDFALVIDWLLSLFVAVWDFLGTAGFLGFAVIGLFVIKKVAQLFKSLLAL